MSTSELVFKTAKELGDLIKRGQISPVELTTSFLDRIESLNPKVNAFITITREHALARAKQAESEIRRGKYRGPLHGIPYAPKDNIATKGILTTNASQVTAKNVPDADSTIVQRMDQAGAVLVGKLIMASFAYGGAFNAGYGQAHNPWNLEYSASGSSSGSGAALASRMIPLSVGTDTGGSIRGPAYANGIVGLKPTYGRISRYGVTTLSWTMDHAGPMATNVADTAMLLQVLAGPDAKDATASKEVVPDYSKALAQGVKGLRIGILNTKDFGTPNKDALTAANEAVKKLIEMGAAPVDVDIPHAKYAGSAGQVLFTAEAASFHEQRMKKTLDLFDPIIQEYLAISAFCSATDYIKTQRVRSILIQEMAQVFEKCDVMIIPGESGPAGRIPTSDVSRTTVRNTPPTAFRSPNFWLANMTGVPSIVIPCGFTVNPTLPLGLSLYANAFGEATLFRVAHAFESATDWHKERPPIA